MKAKLIKLENGKYDLLVDTNLKTLANTKLSTKNCQAIERGYDLDKLADEYYRKLELVPYKSNSFKAGFQKALELMEHRLSKETEWDVEIVMQEDKDVLVNDVREFLENLGDKPLLDADGCLILKRL